MVHFAGYLKQEGDNCKLTIQAPKEMCYTGTVDANSLTNKDHHKSISGGFHTVKRSIVSWSSKTQTWSALSSTEAQYYSLSLGAQEFLFLYSLMKKLGLTVGPRLIFCNKTGAIQLMKNCQDCQHMEHKDTCHHCVCNLW